MVELRALSPQNAEAGSPTTVPLPPLLWLARANRLATVARLLENIVHEANNALQVISGQAELVALTTTVDPAARQRVVTIGDKARSTSTVLQELLALARDVPDHADRFTLRQIAEQAIGLRRYALNKLRIAVTLEAAADDAVVMANHQSILQVVLNLVFNAEQVLAGRPSGVLRLHTGRQDDSAELVVEDNGPGLADDPLAWDPEVLSGPTRLGVGLRVAAWIAEQQGGRLSWTMPSHGSGCRVTLSLPVVR